MARLSSWYQTCLAGQKQGRENRDEIIICANLGLAIDDMVTAIEIYKKAVENNIGTWLEL